MEEAGTESEASFKVLPASCECAVDDDDDDDDDEEEEEAEEEEDSLAAESKSLLRSIAASSNRCPRCCSRAKIGSTNAGSLHPKGTVTKTDLQASSQ